MLRHLVTFSKSFPILTIWTQRRPQTFSSCDRNSAINQELSESLGGLEHKDAYFKDSVHSSIDASGSSKFTRVDTSVQDGIQKFSSRVTSYKNYGAAFHRSNGREHLNGALEVPVANTKNERKPFLQQKCAVMDFSLAKENIKNIRPYFKKLFPRLNLCIDHSEGVDVQGQKTHTISLYLKEAIPGSTLSTDEASALSKFKGDSIGVGYYGTLRRALREACSVAGLSLSLEDSNNDQVSSTSLLSLYLGILRTTCTSLKILLSYDTHEGEERVKIIIQDGKHQLASTHAKRQFTLSLLFAAVEAAAIKKDALGAAKIAQRIANSPLVVLLPDQNIRVKQVLRHLLNYHYGIPDEYITFDTQQVSGSLFSCDVVVKLPPHLITNGRDAAQNSSIETSEHKIVLGSCVANGRKLTQRLATVLILENHFSAIFREQLAFHPAIKELLEQANKLQHSSAAPHLSQGLSKLLEWALHREGRRFEMVYRFLQANTTYHDIRVHTRLMCWRTSLSIFNGSESELLAVAYDVKKKKSELKAIASALAKHFGTLCAQGIAHAQLLNLIDVEGNPCLCEGVDLNITQTAEDEDLNKFQYSDPFLSQIKLKPVQDLFTAPPQSEPSLLSLFRRFSVAYEQHLSKVGPASPAPATAEFHVREVLQWDAVASLWTASLYTEVSSQPPSVDLAETLETNTVESSAASCRTLLSTSSSRYQGCALLRMFGNWLKKMIQGQCSDAETMFFASQIAQEMVDSIRVFIETLPKVVVDDKIVEPVLTAVAKLYGVGVQMRMRATTSGSLVELWGCAAESTGFQNEDRGAVLLTPWIGEETPPYVAEIETDIRIFLGSKSCSSLTESVIQCCHFVHVGHILPWLDILERLLPSVSQLELVVCQKSKLAELVNVVATEIELASCDACCVSKLMVHYNRFPKNTFKIDFFIVSKEKEVLMETVQTDNFMSALQLLCQNISAEMGSQVEVAIPDSSVLNQPQMVIKLQELCKKTFGLPLNLENDYFNGKWRCRIVLELDSEHRYCLVAANGTRKKEASYRAAFVALKKYFGLNVEDKELFLDVETANSNYIYAVSKSSL